MKPISVFLLILYFLVISCAGKKSEVVKKTVTQDSAIYVNKKQFLAEKMQLGEPELHSFENVIKANGYILAPSNGKAQVFTHVGGLIRSINLQVGDFVKKGQVLCTIESDDVIMLQQDYLETGNRLKRAKADYERLKILKDDRISSQKDFLNAESEYKSMADRYEGLKERINLLDLNPEKVQAGNIDPYLIVYSPISGYITAQTCYLGQYADPQKSLMEIIDMNLLQLKINVFEKDVSDLKKGQLIRFFNPHRKDKIYLAELSLIGKSVDPETKTIPCIGTILNGNRQMLIEGMYIESELVTQKREASSIPSDAIMKSGNDYFILIKEKEDTARIYFKKQQVKLGSTSEDYSEVIFQKPLNNILIKGGYNIQKD